MAPIPDVGAREPAERKPWTMVRVGLYVSLGATVLSLLGVLLALLPALLLSLRDPLLREEVQMVTAFGLWLGIGGSLLWVVGQGLCCSVPRSSGAWGLALSALLGSMLAVLMAGAAALTFLSRPGPNPPAGAAALLVVSGLLNHLTLIVFVLFLRAVAEFFDRDLLKTALGAYLAAYAVLILLGLVLRWVSTGPPEAPRPLTVLAQGLVNLLTSGGLIVLIAFTLRGITAGLRTQEARR